MSIFDILGDIIRDKTGNLCKDAEFDKAFIPFMVNRYLSMRPEFLETISECIRIGDKLSKEQYYKLLVSSIPRSNNAYCAYIKKTKNKE
jgi:hypothetical protein